MKSIRGKILVSMSVTVLVVLGILGSASVYLNYSSSNEVLEMTLKEMAVVASERVSKELASYTNVAWEVGSTARLADPAQSIENKKQIIDQKAKTHGFQRGNIIGSDGISIFDGKDYSDRKYFQVAMKGVSHVSEPLVSKITGKLSIMVAAPLWEKGVPNTKVIGVVYFVPNETFLNDIVSNVHISDHSAAYAINADGVTIADNTLDTIMTQNIEEEVKTDPSLKQLAQIHAKMRQGENGFGPYVINGKKKFAAYAPIDGSDGWSISITAPVSDFMDSTYLSIAITVVLLAVSLVAAILVSYRLANGIGIPLQRCANRLKDLAEGDLKSEVPQINNKDETGILAETTETIVSTIRGIITDIDWGLGEMAAGNFLIDSNAKELYVGDYKPLAESMYKIMDQLTRTLLQIDQSAEQVASGSEQVSIGAQALSQGATEQASSVEELAAAITEISGKVKDTAQNALEARGKTEQAGKEISSCSMQMEEMITAISEISDKSTEIGKIIKTIEDIAFQTNILALNAAVEAARAGVAGKGFAVVADEVRNLASKSAEASKNTSALIEGAVSAVERGTVIADETAQSLNKVVENEKLVAVIVDKIADAASEQSEAIAQVTLGVDQISSVVQNNSATAEESAAASEELAGQAQMLKGYVARFQLRRPGDA